MDLFDVESEDVWELPNATKYDILKGADLSENDPYHILEDDAGSFLILPKIDETGRLSEEEAMSKYETQNVHFGIFDSEYSAHEYAQKLEWIAKNIEIEE